MLGHMADEEEPTRQAIDHRNLADASTLKALAHPLRLRLLEAIWQMGSANAAELATLLENTQATCSWHLRHLAKFGYLQEVPNTNGRQRRWELVPQTQSISDNQDDRDLAGNASAVETLLARELEALVTWRSVRYAQDQQLREAATQHATWCWLTIDEMNELSRAFDKIIDDHVAPRALRTHFDHRPPAAYPVRVVSWVIPAMPSSPDHSRDTYAKDMPHVTSPGNQKPNEDIPQRGPSKR